MHAQDTILKIARQRYPDRVWGAACTAGSEQSISCGAVFSASVDEPLTTLESLSLDAGQLLRDEGMKSGDFDFGSAGPAELANGVLVVMDLQCTKPIGTVAAPNFGDVELGSAAFFALVSRYACTPVSGDPASGVFPVGGGFRVPG